MANSQTFTLNFDAKLNVSQMKGAIGNIQSELNRLQLPQNLTRGITGTLASLEKELRNFEVASTKDLGQKNNFSAFERSAERISSLFKDLQIQARDLGQGISLDKFFPPNVVQTIEKASTALKNYESEVDKLNRKVSSQKGSITKALANQTVAKDNLDEAKTQLDKFAQDYQQTLTDLFNRVKIDPKNIVDQASIDQAISEAEKRIERLKQIQNDTNAKGQTYKYADSTKDKAKAEQAALEQLIAEYLRLQEVQKQQSATIQKLSTAYDTATNRVKAAQVALKTFEDAAKTGTTDAFNKLLTELNKIGIDTTNITSIDQAKAALESFAKTAEGEAAAALEKLRAEVERQRPTFDDNADAVRQNADAYKQFNDSIRDVSALKSRIQYFFGLNNAINLVKRAIRGAIETVKDLDKAMTETAVVTSNTISDMWAKLPEYTKRANELGVSTLEAYQAATLYYQQGLNDDQAAALSVETLKMARIAGLEAADATDRMTNALRGFNMELNEVSAQKVDDVYSQLAAMSASNVDEISTAMTKVASLAHNANMEFETTAAFLAQIIETTRESAETAGTALKTVVARFSEVKKLYDMNELKGTDEEGQIIDVNKVGAALRTAGIDLNKYFLGEVGLDDIFMELASKWNSLTSVQQRYIATQAAGSRQQSRFIALMQDYARTQQLVSAAYNANGASAKQFEKTQESLQSKLARLKNAWNEFLMGLANNSIIKGAVDLLTLLLNVVNKLTGAFGTGAGSVLKWVTAVSAFAGIKSLFRGGGLLDRGLMTMLSGTGLGNALAKAGILSGATFGTPADTGAVYSKSGKLIGHRLGSATGTTGAAGGSFLGSLLGKAGAGFTKLGDKALAGQAGLFGKIGTKIVGSGSTAMLSGIATALSAVVVAGTAALVIYGAWRKFSPEGQLKTAKKEAEKANKEAQEAQEDYKKLNSLQDTYKEKTEEINKTTNAQDRQAAIESRNEAILDAIKEDGTLAQYVVTESVDNEIVLKVDEASLAEAARKASETAADAAVKARFGEANVDIKQGNVAKSQLERLYRRVTNENPDFLSAEQIYEKIVANNNISEAQRSKAADYYLQYINSRGAAEQQAKLAYGQQLSRLNVSDELTNALMPLLSEAYLQNQKQLDKDSLKSIIGINNISEIAEAFSGAIKSDKSLVNFNATGDLTDILGIDIEATELQSSFQQLATTLGLSEEAIKNTIKQNVKLQKQRQEEVAKQATMTMVQGNMVRKDSYSDKTMAKYLALENFDDQQFVANLLGQIGNADYANLLVKPIIDAMSTPGAWENSSLQKWVDSIDFSNPIQAFNVLNSAAKDTESEFQNIANEILQTSGAQAQFSNSAQLGYLITSQGYDALSESLSKFIEENGKITSTNVKELAESNEDLNAILENNVTTARGLAEILTHIEDGTIQVWDLSDAVIAATAAMDDLDGIVESTIDDLNSFNAGFDENDITDFIQKAYKTISGNLEKGAIGNNQNRTYLEKIFGDDIFNFGNLPVDEWGRQYEQKVSQLTGILEANQENMYSAWQGVLGTYNTKSKEQLQIFERDNQIFIEGARVTTDELIDIVAEQSGLGEQWARMMVADYKNNSPDFAYQQGLVDLEEGIKIWADELGTINGSKIYTDTDIHTLATLFNVDATAVENAIKGLGDSAGELNKIDFNFDKKGTVSAEDYIQTFEKLGVEVRGLYNQIDKNGNPIKELLTQSTLQSDSNKIINFDQLKQAFSDAGLSNAFEGVLNDCVQAGDHFVAEVGGQLRDIEVQAGETASDAYNRVVQSVADQQFADQIGESVAEALRGLEGEQDVQVNFLVNREEVDAFVKEKHETPGTVNWTNNYPGPPIVEDLHRTIYWTHEGYEAPAATGGIVKSYASGSASYQLNPGPALTGEEGPEIVWNKDKGYAYITGENHPEFQNLQPGDRVFNAQETKKILGGAAAGGKVPSLARGYVPGTSSSGGGRGGSGGSDGETPDEWKNDLDWLYNLMEDIAELERDQKAIEERYEDYLSDQSKTGGDLYKLLVQQLGNLYTQLNHQTFALEKREQEMREFMDVTNDQDQYLWYNWEDRTLEIDWDAIDQITDEEQYKHVKELIDEAESIQDKMDDADDAVMDITNQIQELENVWRDTYVDFEGRVLDALVKSYQQVIDKYSELNTTLNDSNAQILDSLQKQISLERQIRDNTKTEEQISDSEARLAYLRRDTSGGNELAALQLERELADQRESYEDTLVDQAISRLQEDNDAAAQQRERQIEIMQAQLDYQSENGEFNAYIKELLTSAMGADGELLTNSDLMNLLKEQENWDAMSDVNKEVWEEELNTTFKEVAAFLLKQNAEENGTFYTALTAAVESVSAAIGSYSQAMAKLGSEISGAGSSGGGGGSGGSGGSFGGGSGSGSGGSSGGGDTKLPQSGAVAGLLAGIGGTKFRRTGGGGCFAPGTKILMSDYSLSNIETIKIGDIVIAYNEQTQQFVPKKVTKSYIHHNTPAMVRLIFIDNDVLELTPGHPLYSIDGWKSLDIENSLYEHNTIATLLHTGDEIIGINGNKIVKTIEWLTIDANYDSYNIEVEDCHTFLANGLVAHNAKVKYATGGLNTATGLAWLDGTPSEPEYVLNARQTEAFLKLADVLPSMMNNTSPAAQNTFGATYVNLSVNLESVSPDYDVDRMVDLVKDKLYDVGSYRNVNSLSFLR